MSTPPPTDKEKDPNAPPAHKTSNPSTPPEVSSDNEASVDVDITSKQLVKLQLGSPTGSNCSTLGSDDTLSIPSYTTASISTVTEQSGSSSSRFELAVNPPLEESQNSSSEIPEGDSKDELEDPGHLPPDALEAVDRASSGESKCSDPKQSPLNTMTKDVKLIHSEKTRKTTISDVEKMSAINLPDKSESEEHHAEDSSDSIVPDLNQQIQDIQLTSKEPRDDSVVSGETELTVGNKEYSATELGKESSIKEQEEKSKSPNSGQSPTGQETQSESFENVTTKDDVSEKTDLESNKSSNDTFSDDIRDATTDTDKAGADVSELSPLFSKERKKIYKMKSTCTQDAAGYLDPSTESPDQPARVHRVPYERSDTLDDASDNFDTQSTRGTPVSNLQISSPPTERTRRALSLPVGTVGSGPQIPQVSRRASSEVPTGSTVAPLMQLPSISPDDMELPLHLVPSSLSSSQLSDMQSNEEEEMSDKGTKNGGTDHSTSPSTKSSDVNAQVEIYQGWIARGSCDNQHLVVGAQPAGPSRIAEDASLLLPPEDVRTKRLSDILETDDYSATSSLSDATTSSDVKNLDTVSPKGSFKDKHLTKDYEESVSQAEALCKTENIKSTGSPDRMEIEDKATQIEKEPSQITDVENAPKQSTSKALALLGIKKTEQPYFSGKEPGEGTQVTSQTVTKSKSRTKRKREALKDSPKGEGQASGIDSDPSAGLNVLGEEGMASKKYRSEFMRPGKPCRIRRSHSTGSVKDEYTHIRNFQEWHKSTTPQKKDPESEESEDDDHKE